MSAEPPDLYVSFYEIVGRYFPDAPARRVQDCAADLARVAHRTDSSPDRFPPELTELAVAFPAALFEAYRMGQQHAAATRRPARRKAG